MSLLLRTPNPYELKRKNRWLIKFPSELGIQQWWLASAARPSISQNEVEIEFLNTSTWVIGRFTWDSIDVTFRDPIGPSASQAIMEWVRLHSESITGRQGYASTYMKDLYIEMLDPTGVVVEKWELQDTMLTNVGFGDLAMSDDGIAEITGTLRFPRAILLY